MPETAAEESRTAHQRVITRLREQAGDVWRLSSGLEKGARSKRTKPGKWSLRELVCHLLRVQQVFDARLDAMLSQEAPAIASYEPDGDPEFARLAELPAERSLADFLDRRERLLARLEKLEPVQWHRKGKHPDYPHYDVHFAMEYLAHHEAHHIFQMYERRAPLAPAPH